MTDVSITIAATKEWVKEATDLRSCSHCGDIIYSEMNVLCVGIKVGSKESEKNPTEFVVCNSCFDDEFLVKIY